MKPTTQPTEAAAPTTAALGVRVTRAIESVRAQFISYAQGFSAITGRGDELAPLFIGAYERWHKKTNGSFVSFVRLFDATVPEDRDEYKKHSTYNAANYLRRTYYEDKMGTDTGAGETVRAISAEAIVAGCVAAILPLIPENSVGAAWKKVQAYTQLSDARIEKAKELAKTADPMLKLRVPKGVPAKHALQIAA